MLRSNSKKAIENIRNYIIENTDFDQFPEGTKKEFSVIAPLLMHRFYDEMIRFNKRNISYQNHFIEWCSGLPSILDTCYYYNRSAVADVAKILEETEAEANKYTEAQAENLLTCLMWRELFKACKYSVK